MRSIVISKPSDYWSFMMDYRYEIHDILMLGHKTARIYYKFKEDYVEENFSSNIIVALWTTSAARVHLYKYMRMVAKTPGCKLYYTDTDSIIFTHPKNECPVPVGNSLGEMSDELPNAEMLEFFCGGNKQYAYRFQDNKTGEIFEKIKIRGITFDHFTSQTICYEAFKEQILNYRKLKPLKTTYTRFQINKDSTIRSKKMDKIYNPVFRKALIDDNLDIYPFGY